MYRGIANVIMGKLKLNKQTIIIEDGKYIIPEGTKTIESAAFKDCEDLKSVILPESLEYIQPNAFLGCKNLKKVFVPDVVEKIEIRINHVANMTIFRPFSELVDLLKEGNSAELKKHHERSWTDWN